MSCCPTDAWGNLGATGYVPKGTVSTVDGLPIYRVGTGDKCIIWNYDIFGFDGGRSKQTADLFATEYGYQVIMPDYYRGEMRDPVVATDLFPWIKSVSVWKDHLEKDVVDRVLPFAAQMGAKRFAAVGTCWGSYMVLKMAAMDNFVGGVSWHPSHTPISKAVGEDAKDLYASAKCPQLFLPAEGDAAEDRTGGLASQVMGSKLEIVDFPDMKHGWTVRGDLADPTVKRDVNKAITLTKEFLDKQFQ